jgi:hypothetical protein
MDFVERSIIAVVLFSGTLVSIGTGTANQWRPPEDSMVVHGKVCTTNMVI